MSCTLLGIAALSGWFVPSTTSGCGVDQSFRPAMSGRQLGVVAFSSWFALSATSCSRVGRSFRGGMSCTLLGIAAFSCSVEAWATSLSDVGRPFGGTSCTPVFILTSSFYSLVSHDIEQCCDTRAPSSSSQTKSTSEAALARVSAVIPELLNLAH